MMSKTAAPKRQNGGRIRNSVCTVLACAALLLAQSCTDVFHELIPPSDSDIHSFSVENTDRTRYCAAETDSTDITITVPAGTDITALIPVIELGAKSTVIPVTVPYLHRAFPSADLMSLAVQMNASQKAGGLGTWMLNFIRENKDFTVPPLDEPVDFTQPVMFCVIAGRGNYKLYTVTVVQEKTENPAEPENPDPSEPDDPETPDTPPVPPATECEKKILSFVINEPKQTKPSVITEDTVAFYLNAGADRSALYPLITVSEGAGILPLTQEYLIRLFSYTEMISFYSGYSSAKDINTFISATVKKLGADKIAKIMESDLSLPIDFSGLNSLFGVPFAVIGADKTAHVYSISCVTDEDSAALTAFAVTKIRNPGLMGDADVSVSGGTVTITATYPVEYRNFTLIPDIVIEGDTWEITGGTLRVEDTGADGAEEAEYTAGLKKAVRLVPGDAYPIGNEYTATLTVRRGEAAATYTLRLIYREDPDTIRSITDFRFLRLRNPGIKATAMASISKNEDTGFISATVLYEGGEPPYDLVADFYSPGTCTVEHIEQVSGKSRNNFQYDVQMLCTSKNKLFCRLYTVQVTFVKVKTAEAVLNYFAFPKHLNPDLSQSATGLIDESSGTVYVNAKYHTPEKPARLVPEFAATGTVTVNSILQSSGYSAQDFSRSVYYAVRDQNEWSSDTRTYRVSVNWEQDEQSACAITDFGFSMADNPSLEKDVSARINERAGTIYALLPKDAGKANLAPYFSAQGTVTVGSAEQTSGRSRLDFSGEIIYTVTSANGLYSKQYAVSVQEAGPVIYVNAAAVGRNNGTCWQDAYITLDAAFEQAAAYGDAHKEIWIAHNGGAAYEPLSDEYRKNGLPLTANTIIRGGFVGGETDANQRTTKQREIAFTVNAVENARAAKDEDKTNPIPISHKADVCVVQTKLCMMANGTGNFFFRTSAPSGEIVFDGIEIEQEEKDNNYLFYNEETDDTDVTFLDCTVRCISSTRYSYNKGKYFISIKDSDFYVSDLYAKSIDASGSNFKPATSNNLTLKYSVSLLLKTCGFQYNVCLSSDAPAYIDSCSFDNVNIYSAGSYETPLHLTNCLCSFDKGVSERFYATEIADCELKNMSGTNILISLIGDATITDSNIEGFWITDYFFNSEKLSVTNSIFRKSSFKYISDKFEIEMTGTTIEDTEGPLTTSCRTLLLKDCTLSDSGQGDSSWYIYGCRDLNIDNCTFNIHISPLIYQVGGNIKIKESKYLNETGNVAISTYDNVEAEITDSTFESKNGYIYLSGITVFTGNKLKGKYTKLITYNIKKLENNHYDNFVYYSINNPLNNSSIDFLTEKIEIKEPLLSSDNTPCTKKAYLNLSDGEIRIDDEKYKNFLCGMNLENASAVVKRQDFGNIPSFLYTGSPVEGSGSVLELTDCTINGMSKSVPMTISFTNATLTNCTVKGTTDDAIKVENNLTVKSSTIEGNIKEINNLHKPNEVTVLGGSTVGDINNAKTINISGNSTVGGITNASTVTGKDSTIDGSIINKNSKSVIELKNTSVTGHLLTTKNSEITMTADSGKNISIGDNGSEYEFYRYSIETTYSDDNGTLSLTNISTSGNISFYDGVVTVTNSQIGGSIKSYNELTAENSTIKESVSGSNTSTTLLKGTTVLESVTNYNHLTIENENKRKTKINYIDIPSYGNSDRKTIIKNAIVNEISIYASNADITIEDSEFSGNQGYSTAIYSHGNNNNITIIRSNFSNYTNGAIEAGYVTTVDNTILGFGNDIKIINSNFTGNTNYGRGGAICIAGKNVSLNNCEFINNRSIASNGFVGGGAVAIECPQDGVTATIDGCTFSSNSCSGGKGHDVFMCAEWQGGNKFLGCTLTITGCSTDRSDNSVFTKNINQ